MRLRMSGWDGRNVITSLCIILATVAAFLGGCELYLRMTGSFTSTDWPSRFDPTFGFNFRPGSTVRHTNNVDFWTITEANSLGFLDREPPGPKAPGTCRIAFIGDSFVEAAQVPIENKVQVVLEKMLSERFPDRRFEAFAFGYSGTGQLNQLPFYDIFARPLMPDVVVLVMVSNDFANNSAVLEAVRNGWHPEHSPRFFARLDPASGKFEPLPIDAEWEEENLSLSLAAAEPTLMHRVHRRLLEASYLYTWLYRNLSIQFPDLAVIESSVPFEQFTEARIRMVESLPGHAEEFAGWSYPNDLHYDTMFYAAEMPAAFEDAMKFTGYALDQFVERSRADGFTLILLTSSSLSARYEGEQTQYGRHLVDRGYYKRLVGLASKRNIPVVDQYDHIVARGGKAEDDHFSRDGHWSKQGHIWAAEAMLDYFEMNPTVCARELPTASQIQDSAGQ